MPKVRSQARDKGSQTGGQPPRRALTRDRIIAGALTLIEREGLDAFSTRKLGAALGVEAMALYHHFPSKEELLDALAEHLLTLVDLPPETLSWRGWLKQVARNYRRMALKHPNTFPILVTRRYRAHGSFAFFEANLRVLTAAGFSIREALRLTRTIGSFVNGVLLPEIAGRKSAGSGDRMARTLPPGLPLIKQAASYLNSTAMDGTFEYGLELIVTAADSKKERLRP
jgi:AcrR family transcriptional regulator